MLGNLKQSYLRSEDYEAALACAERTLLLMPDAPLELRDRGLIFAKLECFGAALRDLERFASFVEDPRLLAPLDELMDGLRERVQLLN